MSYYASAHGRGVAGHAERLPDGLAAPGQQVRAAIAHVVGRAVADATRDGVRHLPGGPPEAPVPPTPRWGEPARPPWRPEGAGRDRRDGDAYRDWRDDPLERGEEDWEPAPTTTDRPPVTEWEGALAAGCQGAAWWLRRRGDRAGLPGPAALPGDRAAGRGGQPGVPGRRRLTRGPGRSVDAARGPPKGGGPCPAPSAAPGPNAARGVSGRQGFLASRILSEPLRRI